MTAVLPCSTVILMPPVNRNKPRKGSASESRYTIFEFDQDFPDDATCLEYLVAKLYPEGIYCPTCQKVTKHHRETKRPSYACQYCGHHEHPHKGTIFENSATSLRLWFYGIYLMASTRCGISAKQLERELGVTYKTAWRMFNKIRSMLTQDDNPFDGTIEVDEVYVGGKARWRSTARSRRRGAPRGGTSDKTPVLGMVQRGLNGAKGKVSVQVVDGQPSAMRLTPNIQKKVLPQSTVFTDEATIYKHLGEKGYQHSRVSHAQEIYVSGDVHTNTIEGFFSLLQRGIGGVYHSVSAKHLQSYLDEYAFRYNNRDAGGLGMFTAMVDRIEKDVSSRPVSQPSPIDPQTPAF